MKTLQLLPLVLMLLPSPGRAAQPVPGQFDMYVLAMSYEEDFCFSHPKKIECQEANGTQAIALHGLWPNVKDDPRHQYQYCDISADEFGQDWCVEKYDVTPQLSPQQLAALTEVMPGVKSCLQNHEWYAHGTCSGMKVAEFFDTTTALSKSFIALKSLPEFLKTNAGGTVSRAQLYDVIRQDLGAASDNAVVVTCRKKGKKAHAQAFFSEVDLTLSRENLVKFPAPESFGQSEPFVRPDGTSAKDVGNCPVDGIIISKIVKISPQ